MNIELLSITTLATISVIFYAVFFWYVNVSSIDGKIPVVMKNKKSTQIRSKYAPHSNSDVEPKVLPDDIIYKNSRTIFVIPQYRLIFFTFPKVACTEWKRMFMRMNGNQNWCNISDNDVHKPKINLISTLADYSPDVATAMMTSPLWTKAAFVREPKERVLSAFLDKSLQGDLFIRRCCHSFQDIDTKNKCQNNHGNFESFLFFVTNYPDKCFNVHWEPQIEKIDKKWWPYIDFIGYQHNLLQDSETLLRSLTSSRDLTPGHTAWEQYGASGWGDDNELCEKRSNSFLNENTSSHNLGTGSHMLEWYTPKAEKIVEENWAVEWQNEKIQYPLVKLFPNGGI